MGSYDDHAWTPWAIGRAGKAWETSMAVRVGNLYVDVSAGSSGEEAFSEIFARPGLKIERIISQGQASPPGFWYDQAWNEWVIVLKGSATLQFEDEPATRALGAGDYVFIPARKRHRVEWTEPQQPTVWLAVHFE
jgi:cupin 2 domain-containing protein